MKTRAQSSDITGPLTLYAWVDKSTGRRSPMVFRANPNVGEWSRATAKFRVDAELAAQKNVRIENQAGEIVFHARRGFVMFPADVEMFWRECGK